MSEEEVDALWTDEAVPPGARGNVELMVSESYSGSSIRIPIHVVRGDEKGPTVFVCAAVHGDEINGTGAIRRLILDPAFELTRGRVFLIPVVNILGFERHSRYLPDRRDLNRSFPGSATGSLASRMASFLFRTLFSRSDYGIDLHTAAVRRTNFPNVRADLEDPESRRLALAFGCELVVNGKGPKGSLRREATRAGCPTILLEAGEVWKVEPAVADYALRGIQNVLIELEMMEGRVARPAFQISVKRTQWIRSQNAGFLQFHVAPGEFVEKGQGLATATSLLGETQEVVRARSSGIVMGMTTLPSVAPGNPVCHLALCGKDPRKDQKSRPDSVALHARVSEDLASNILITEPDE